MIIKAQALDRLLTHHAPVYRAVLFYGPNEGRVREYAMRIARNIVPDQADPFRISTLGVADLKDDPARLADEAGAIAMTGGRRIVRLRGVSDAHIDNVNNFLESSTGDSMVIIEAGELPKSSKLRKLFETHAACAIAACYEESAADLQELVVSHLRMHGLSINSDAKSYILHCLGQDRLASRQELDKLVLYMGAPKPLSDISASGDIFDISDVTDVTGGAAVSGIHMAPKTFAARIDDRACVTLSDVTACIGDSSVQGFDQICDAMAQGDVADLDNQLMRAFDSALSPIAILRSASNHLLRLQLALAALAQTGSIDMALRTLRPPLFFGREDSFRQQMRKWTLVRLAHALDMLLQSESLCKTTGAPDLSLCSQAMHQVASLAQRNK